MRFQLTEYQLMASSDVLEAIGESAARFGRNGKLSAISLSAPTGAGKTVIATDVIEAMLFGSEHRAPSPQTTFLWVTDDPSLNAQTKRKMLTSSSKLRPSRLIAVDPSLDQQILDTGRVYFVHIQQLGKGAKKYIKTGNSRQYSLWETIGQTIAERGSELILIVDEAHRGTSLRSQGSKTIVSQLMDGWSSEFPPAPIVIGISATPQRFAEAISRTSQRVFSPITVDNQAVRLSGLLKDKIRIGHPKKNAPGDTTLLARAVEDLKLYDALWSDYASKESEPLVRPALVVQVKAKSSEKELSGILAALESGWSVLSGKAIGHSFQEHSTLKIGNRTLRYVAPQDIQDDTSIRAVLFKEALTTGWDCPRAEVMISLRTARDFTYISQLVGRMVRTPLAKRIDTNELLNSVSLYLPHFDSEQIEAVVTGLQSEEQIVSEVEVNGVVCDRNPEVPQKIWETLQRLPTYTRPSRTHRNEVVRLNSLATLLNGVGLLKDAINRAEQHIIGTLSREDARLRDYVSRRVAELERLDYASVEIDLVSGEVKSSDVFAVRDGKNVEDLFKRAKRSWGDAAAQWYWLHLCDAGVDSDAAKLTVAALAEDASVAEAINGAAKQLVDLWRNTYNSEISALPGSKRAAFYAIWQQARSPEQVRLILPSQITAPVRDDHYERHVYSSNGKFPIKLTSWERGVLEAEISRDSLLAWYRNPSSGSAALAVPYSQSGSMQTMYPDFIFFHQKGPRGGVAVDIIDPHRPNEADCGPKWLGLSKYATEHGSSFRRVLAVIQDHAGDLLGLDLKNPQVQAALSKASTEPDIRSIFAQFGGLFLGESQGRR